MIKLIKIQSCNIQSFIFLFIFLAVAASPLKFLRQSILSKMQQTIRTLIYFTSYSIPYSNPRRVSRVPLTSFSQPQYNSQFAIREDLVRIRAPPRLSRLKHHNYEAPSRIWRRISIGEAPQRIYPGRTGRGSEHSMSPSKGCNMLL